MHERCNLMKHDYRTRRIWFAFFGRNFCKTRRKKRRPVNNDPCEGDSTAANLSLGGWPATNTCFLSGRITYTVPSLALRRADLPSCTSQPKSDGHQLPCGGPLPEHGTTTLNSCASKQSTGYAAFRLPKVIRNPLPFEGGGAVVARYRVD